MKTQLNTFFGWLTVLSFFVTTTGGCALSLREQRAALILAGQVKDLPDDHLEQVEEEPAENKSQPEEDALEESTKKNQH